ncbi:DUF3987 domain-containing protein [Gemmata obscuriglobus]|uniref:DUF3987 domain-containing protein n=1 Tax=Gemmata obscuriglobus TaxID=114 RepID=UPI00137BAE33|nr:DUF3987 domain-containing protein [Gemmata obscuriglobus]VTS07399.1 Uncharacterized protein OS=Kyrpidia tusciae (strain DSM 2912 / NBRC 15312 / T2) GN=Btus_1941 PE=4 SV=1: Prim-Pol: DUF3987 [Gemmata obscuriglobus UQM 2246]
MSHAENPLLAAALDYAGRGWRVVPLHGCVADERRTDGQVGCSCGNPECGSQGKHPRLKAWQKEASVDPAQVGTWWAAWPEANVGVALGPESGVVAIDVDTKAGEQLVKELAGDAVERTALFRTGKGHRLLYAVPADLPAPPATRAVKLGGSEAVRFQSTGSQCVMPPSLHPSGNFYEWVEGRDPAACPSPRCPTGWSPRCAGRTARSGPTRAPARRSSKGRTSTGTRTGTATSSSRPGSRRPGQANGVMRFTRPGKRSGISVTVGHYRARDGSPALYVFSGSIPGLDAGRCYDKFGRTRSCTTAATSRRPAPRSRSRGSGGRSARPRQPRPDRQAGGPGGVGALRPAGVADRRGPGVPAARVPAGGGRARARGGRVRLLPDRLPGARHPGGRVGRDRGLVRREGEGRFLPGAGLFCALVGDPSAKKSPPIKHVIRPMQKEQADRVEKIRDEYGDELPEMYKEGEGELFVSDVTVEKLGEMLQRQPRGLLLYKPELVGWLLAQNQYKAKGVGSDRSFFLEVYDSEPITVHRKGGAAIHVSRPSLTMVGATQPDVVREFFDRRDGLAERILWAYPAALPPRGERFYEVPFALSSQWGQVLKNLWCMTMEPAGLGKKRPRAHVLPLSDAGREAWRAYTDRLAATMSDPDFPPWMRSAYGKFEGSAARLALVLQLLALAGSDDSDPPACIEAQWVTAAAEMVFYFGAHARGCTARAGVTRGSTGPSGSCSGSATAGSPRSSGPSCSTACRRNPMFRKPEDLNAPLQLLDAHNAIRVVPPPAERTAGRPPTPVYEVSPQVFTSPDVSRIVRIDRAGPELETRPGEFRTPPNYPNNPRNARPTDPDPCRRPTRSPTTRCARCWPR